MCQHSSSCSRPTAHTLPCMQCLAATCAVARHAEDLFFREKSSASAAKVRLSALLWWLCRTTLRTQSFVLSDNACKLPPPSLQRVRVTALTLLSSLAAGGTMFFSPKNGGTEIRRAPGRARGPPLVRRLCRQRGWQNGCARHEQC